ncbi:hypothetical protein GS624_01120 [Ruegeria sp. HKCCD5849]|uniref:hypothetical protein n=1 Tax=unclassified Ruegeria TaxID=2625375 RepID=UPI0014919E42|nr:MULTISPECIES: hypothetical protein [unclassified Ruegeria]NOD45905.1 hypothetical protein [Ruegeria sp. HKCCD5849]NOD50795.1 hypothetical protein [Ruegeria sp. HKCCD5851]
MAADIEVLRPEGLPLAEVLEGRCTIALSGPIEQGDSAKLNDLFFDHLDPVGITGSIDEDLFEMSERAHTLCLNSAGGDFDEALEILKSEFMNLIRVITVVPNGSECLSACALVFLGGTLATSNSDGGNTLPVRVLSTGGRLGFHSPFVGGVERLPNVLPRDAVVEFFSSGADAIRRLNDVFTNQYVDTHGPVARFPPDLLIELLGFRGVNDYFEISTVNDAGRFDIYLADIPQIKLSREGLARLCVNASMWSIGKMSPHSPDIPSWGYSIETSGNTASLSARHYACEITYLGKKTGDDYRVVFSDRQGTEQVRYMEAWESLPHYTPIRSLRKFATITLEFEPLYNYTNPLELEDAATIPVLVEDSISIVRTHGGETGFGDFRLRLLGDGRFTIEGNEIGEFAGEYDIRSKTDICLEFETSAIDSLLKKNVCGRIDEGDLKFEGIEQLSGLVEFQRSVFLD